MWVLPKILYQSGWESNPVLLAPESFVLPMHHPKTIYLIFGLPNCLFVYLSICLFVYLSICPFVYLSMCSLNGSLKWFDIVWVGN